MVPRASDLHISIRLYDGSDHQSLAAPLFFSKSQWGMCSKYKSKHTWIICKASKQPKLQPLALDC